MVESHADKIAPVVAAQWAAAKARGDPETVGRKEPKAGFRAAMAREVYRELPVEEKAAIAWAKEEYKRALENPPSNKPEDRQR
jgi:hypothetical protein